MCVRAVSRRAATGLPAAVEVVTGDAADAASARQAVAGASVVYNCTNAPYTAWPEQFPTLWRNVTTAAAAVGAKLVVADNLYMYGQTNAPMTETTPYNATGRKGRTCITMAEELLEAHRRGTVRVAIGRSADYYGPHISLLLYNDAFFRRALMGKRVLLMGIPDLPHSQAFIGDVARGLATLGERDEALGQIWHLPHAAPITQREFIATLFAVAAQPPRLIALPTWIVQAAGLVVPMARELAEMRYQYDAPFVVQSTKFEQAFGIAPTAYREGIYQTLAWLRTQPQAQAVAAH